MSGPKSLDQDLTTTTLKTATLDVNQQPAPHYSSITQFHSRKIQLYRLPFIDEIRQAPQSRAPHPPRHRGARMHYQMNGIRRYLQFVGIYQIIAAATAAIVAVELTDYRCCGLQQASEDVDAGDQATVVGEADFLS